ncbi:M20/M25/M40 family metallo-hydrolase [Streptomyces sp. N2-109]|uniref:M20/M25/M40 family metallo-hydrolase n=1 Tax=Streptomyces gossypii TaxID=2883101 RepID=A0ABT2JXC8_9ACTN|nr:M20/M25/M40 family metallo-hydrolase [Streptomyces gossypii]MCT2592553.1 M20/M25/M40 family metallo-hydrolase [Streptomyces gossypii]
MSARPLYVIKVGSSTLLHPTIFAEIAAVHGRGARVLVVAGGAEGIERHYGSIGRTMPSLTLRNGDTVRYCPPGEMPHIADAYLRVTLPAVEAGLTAHGLTVLTHVAAHEGLVTGTVNKPLRVAEDGRSKVVRDHRAGTVRSVEAKRLGVLLDAYDVVCLSPPVRDADGGSDLNVDADVLAATLANALDADHLRLVTGTAGILTDPSDPASTLRDAFPGTAGAYAGGRMKQKVRAAELGLLGTADVAVTGPHTMDKPAGWTRFWVAGEPSEDLALLSRTTQIPSTSYDEHEVVRYLVRWCRERGIEARADEAGNLVAERGDGPRTLLLLGHADTVPFIWPVSWDSAAEAAEAAEAPTAATGQDAVLRGRGSVDAKASLVAFLEALADAEIPDGWRLRVVGAVEEEVSSSKGAFHTRDHYPADAVVVGEPSGSGALTLGYFGLFKLRVTVTVRSGHSAGFQALSAPDHLTDSLAHIRRAVLKEADEALSAVIDLSCSAGTESQTATAILNFRVPPMADLDALRAAATEAVGEDVVITFLRATPGYAGGRSTPLAKAFGRALNRKGIRPRFLVKKGTSDMNTLATTWRGVPMVAYGPGDSALDHTAEEHIGAAEYRRGRAVLREAVTAFFDLAAPDGQGRQQLQGGAR